MAYNPGVSERFARRTSGKTVKPVSVKSLNFSQRRGARQFLALFLCEKCRLAMPADRLAASALLSWLS
jgi:hypothetical protein